MSGHRFEGHSWRQLEDLYAADPVIVLSIASAASQHGDGPVDLKAIIAREVEDRLLPRERVLIMPPMNYGSFGGLGRNFPGSAFITPELTSRVIVELVRSVAAHGPRRFYFNVPVQALPRAAVRAAGELLVREGTAVARMSTGTRPLIEMLGFEYQVGHWQQWERQLYNAVVPEHRRVSTAPELSWNAGIPPNGAYSRDPANPTYTPHGGWGAVGTPFSLDDARMVLDSMVDATAWDIRELAKTPPPPTPPRSVGAPIHLQRNDPRPYSAPRSELLGGEPDWAAVLR